MHTTQIQSPQNLTFRAFDQASSRFWLVLEPNGNVLGRVWAHSGISAAVMAVKDVTDEVAACQLILNSIVTYLQGPMMQSPVERVLN